MRCRCGNRQRTRQPFGQKAMDALTGTCAAFARPLLKDQSRDNGCRPTPERGGMVRYRESQHANPGSRKRQQKAL